MTCRAKIVCTMGPATSSEEGIAALLDAGMNVARMNFSHGDYADHKIIYDRLRTAAASADTALAILADLQGPKIRLGRFAAGSVLTKTSPCASPATQTPGPAHPMAPRPGCPRSDMRPRSPASLTGALTPVAMQRRVETQAIDGLDDRVGGRLGGQPGRGRHGQREVSHPLCVGASWRRV